MAARIGEADIEAGRYHSLDSVAALEAHLAELADEVLSDQASPNRRR